MFKTKGFSSNNSLKRRAVIVDAPDLPPEECEFFITSAGIADTENVEILKIEDSVLDYKELYKEIETSEKVPLTDVKGIGNGTAENLCSNGINTLNELINANPEELSTKISGISTTKILEWQVYAKSLIKS